MLANNASSTVIFSYGKKQFPSISLLTAASMVNNGIGGATNQSLPKARIALLFNSFLKA